MDDLANVIVYPSLGTAMCQLTPSLRKRDRPLVHFNSIKKIKINNSY